MWIEQRKIQFVPLEIKQKSDSYIFENGGKKQEVSKRQFQYWDYLHNGYSIHQLVNDFIAKGWLVSFRELYSMLESMAERHWIQNPEIQSYFSTAAITHSTTSATGISELSQQMKHLTGVQMKPENLKTLPFFRNLPADIQKVFVQNTVIQKIPNGTRLCKSGDRTRDMFALLEGTVGVYRVYSDGKRQLISSIPQGSTFGEGGFLLDRPRGADVITLAESTIATIHYTPELNQIVNSEKAEALQRRFWVLQGLLSSELFSHIPSETLDSLVFSGKLISVRENEIVVQEGEPGNSFYIIIQGNIVFIKNEKSIRVLGQGGTFGEVALMVSGGTRTATAKAQRDSLLLQIGMEEFYNILSNHLILAKELEGIAWRRWEGVQK